ncbi:MAG: accessory factor UbiK family protein [Thiopseudomonas sp.]|nr:accessory factor UbiK family protein [Thiopseudomonas sp.]
MLAAKPLLESLAARAADLLDAEGPLSRNELEGKLKQMLHSQFARLDLVSRDEFDGQTLVLQRTRQRLEQLEQQVAKLERQLASQDTPPPGH